MICQSRVNYVLLYFVHSSSYYNIMMYTLFHYLLFADFTFFVKVTLISLSYISLHIKKGLTVLVWMVKLGYSMKTVLVSHFHNIFVGGGRTK